MSGKRSLLIAVGFSQRYRAQKTFRALAQQVLKVFAAKALKDIFILLG